MHTPMPMMITRIPDRFKTSHKSSCNAVHDRYDDWPMQIATHGPAKGTNLYGQARAHYELTEKYQVRWKPIGERGSLQVLSIGKSVCDPALCEGVPDLRDTINLTRSLERGDTRPLLGLWGATRATDAMGTLNFRAVNHSACVVPRSGPKRKTLPACALKLMQARS